jgi:hypothetical protein
MVSWLLFMYIFRCSCIRQQDLVCTIIHLIAYIGRYCPNSPTEACSSEACSSCSERMDVLTLVTTYIRTGYEDGYDLYLCILSLSGDRIFEDRQVISPASKSGISRHEKEFRALNLRIDTIKVAEEVITALVVIE